MTAKKASVLIVEDDPEQIRLYAKALRGFALTCVATGTAALSSLDEEVPDLIILDHVLADGETGTEFLPKLKNTAAHVPVIVISGTLDIKGQLAALQGPLSANYVIEKPVRLADLRATVDRALSECGFGETVAMLESLERTGKEDAADPDRRYTERLARQHAILNALRDTGEKPNISALARDHKVARRTIHRDLDELVARGQLDPAVLGENGA